MKESRPQGLGRRTFGGLAAGLGLAVVLSGCGGSSDPLSNAPASSGTASGGTTSLVIGSADFPESQIIAELYAGALSAAGVTATTKPNIGSREVYFKAVQDGSVDVVPDYTGNLLLHVDKEATEISAEEIAKALPDKLPDGLAVLDAAKAEDKDAMVVTKATAEKYQLKTIEDLAKVCSEIVVGAPATFAERAYGLPGLKKNYNCEPKKLEPFSDGGGPVTLKALLEDQVQVADIYTTTPSIAEQRPRGPGRPEGQLHCPAGHPAVQRGQDDGQGEGSAQLGVQDPHHRGPDQPQPGRQRQPETGRQGSGCGLAQGQGHR
jgi:osmoprotectant transport system substrate-binding protein